MGPRLFTAERLAGAVPLYGLQAASMGPRLFTAERAPLDFARFSWLWWLLRERGRLPKGFGVESEHVGTGVIWEKGLIFKELERLRALTGVFVDVDRSPPDSRVVRNGLRG